MRKTLHFFLLLFLISLALPAPAPASQPVPRTLEGCVINGTFFSVYKGVKTATGRNVLAYRILVQNMDLSRYEGKKIRLQGYLSPGDRFQADPKSLKVLGPCDQGSKQAISQSHF